MFDPRTALSSEHDTTLLQDQRIAERDESETEEDLDVCANAATHYVLAPMFDQ